MTHFNTLLKRIKNKKAAVGLVGVGYVGSAIGIGASEAGYKVLGYARKKKSTEKINELGIANFRTTNEFSDLGACDIVCICVPTPVHSDKTPDVGPMRDSLTNLSKHLRKGQLVVVESSIAPGMTRSIALPILKKSGLTEERDFFLAFSPERIDPGNKKFTFAQIPKVVGGLSEHSRKLTEEFYKRVVVMVHSVSSLEVAEMSKVFENTFRLVNISLVNELSAYAKAIGVDIVEVIEAAATKPFGFLPHYPGPGVGGHCIPVDPYYLMQDARNKGINLGIVEQAGKVNDARPGAIVDEAISILRNGTRDVSGKKVLLVGVTYKPDVDDIRESPALSIWKRLQDRGLDVAYHDPYVARVNGLRSIAMELEHIRKHDLIVVVTHHSKVDYDMLLKSERPILDTRKVFNGSRVENVYFV